MATRHLPIALYALLAWFLVPVLSSCGDENDYYNSENPKEEQETLPDYTGRYILEARAANFFSDVARHYDTNGLFPSWILQLDDLKEAYPNSSVVQEATTNLHV